MSRSLEQPVMNVLRVRRERPIPIEVICLVERRMMDAAVVCIHVGPVRKVLAG